MGKLTEDEVRNNVKPLMYTRLRLGEFDPPELNPYTKIPMSVVQSKEHRALAIKAAVMSFVLLKNDKNTLPLKTPLSSAAIVGPFGDNLKALYGDYSAIINATYAKTPLAGLKQIAHSVRNASGCDNVHCKKYNQGAIKAAVKGADVIIVCLGLGNAQETEGNDRKTLDLPGKQLQLLQDVISYGSGRPVILLLFNAGPLDVGFAQNSPHVHSILACFYPAQATGQALYNVITGKYSPAGRLTATWPLTLDQVPPITNYSMEGHTYRYYSGDPLYPFGYGLSYSSFTYSHLSISPSRVTTGSNVIVSVDVTNHGNMAADEVVQVYISWVCSPVPTPKLQLVAFNRTSIADQQTVTLIIDAEQMAVWLDDDTGFSIPKGKYEVFVGGQQPNQKTKVPSNVLSGSFTVI